MRERDCPRCGGSGKVPDERPCECGHRREDHYGEGVGCVGYAGYCLDECKRYRAAADE